MSIFDWFKKKEPEDYEQVLESLALDIQKRQARLSEIKLRERRTTLWITIYALTIWAAYVASWYVGWRPLKAFPIFIGPIIAQFSRRISQMWYARIENAEEKTLKELLSQQRTKVEEIKKKTNYYSTKHLIERYDPPSGFAGSPARPRPDAPPNQAQRGVQQQPTTPQRGPLGQPNGYPQPNRGQPSNMPVPDQQTPQAALVPPKKQWFDRLADALLGDDELGADGAKNRYALICQKCFAHNGLVKEELWEDTQFVCPKCGAFNPSMRALKAAHAGSRSPTSAQTQPQAQRRPGPRMSAPISGTGPSLRAEESSYDRRRSMPAPDVTTLTDEEEEQGQRPRRRRSPLAQNIPLPDDEEESEPEPQVEDVEGPHRRRRLIVVDDD
ncbi:hypothetical protein A7U60_g809 [Sanghuangporus baumii]|uniref:Endoplasmic reticulum junction formation protein lunapark n=1 Tax=Sanghuangporus baumii TaxID=108892 RepID=A0A9Q5I512_SANBA|nr:hypothetical protein A7U60_g809 [Sanghuangporus baumii]